MTGMMDWLDVAAECSFAAADFSFADGATADLRLAYRTLGTLAPDRGNAILMLHGTTGSGTQFLEPTFADAVFGAGEPLDINDYFVILPDAIGHGRSSKPSDGMARLFPRYGYTDIVAAQHLLVTQGLGLRRLRLVMGTSMGGMQTWIWGVRYPDMMDALMPVASLPERVTGRNLLWRRLLLELAPLDAAQSGDQPTGLGLAWVLFNLMSGSPARMAETLKTPEEADAYIEAVAKQALEQDLIDVLWEFEASHDYDPGPDLGRIQAPLLAVNFADDEVNPAQLGVMDEMIAQVRRGQAVLVSASEDSQGHQTLKHPALWSEHLRLVLQRSEQET
jgi:homoserine O-acetyltransferase/O-succinyltransferase